MRRSSVALQVEMTSIERSLNTLSRPLRPITSDIRWSRRRIRAAICGWNRRTMADNHWAIGANRPLVVILNACSRASRVAAGTQFSPVTQAFVVNH